MSTLENFDGVHNNAIINNAPFITPTQLKHQLPITSTAAKVISESRQVIRNILHSDDPRLIVIVGPCSIHDPKAAMDYARRLAKLKNELDDRYFLVMRAYFEKPRTNGGWKGFLSDPHLDTSCDMAYGIYATRKLLLDILELGLPTATEFLNPNVPKYIDDLITWGSIGARTSASQIHREMASGLSMPIGFKNGTDGNIDTAISAVLQSHSPHSLLGIDDNGRLSLLDTDGNPDTHIVLRGGRTGPNYDEKHVKQAVLKMCQAGLSPNVIVDCSHDNSAKNHILQTMVWENVLQQRATGAKEIKGIMLESNIYAGKQPLSYDPSKLRYGISITDACIDWETTEFLFKK